MSNYILQAGAVPRLQEDTKIMIQCFGAPWLYDEPPVLVANRAGFAWIYTTETIETTRHHSSRRTFTASPRATQFLFIQRPGELLDLKDYQPLRWYDVGEIKVWEVVKDR